MTLLMVDLNDTLYLKDTFVSEGHAYEWLDHLSAGHCNCEWLDHSGAGHRIILELDFLEGVHSLKGLLDRVNT